LVLSPEATEDEIAATVERVDVMITGRGGEIGEHQIWGLKRLAFPIMKFREGNYVLTKFSLASSAAPDLTVSLNAAQDIMRFLVTKV
jgi:small subunit ribosomal protein S6